MCKQKLISNKFDSRRFRVNLTKGRDFEVEIIFEFCWLEGINYLLLLLFHALCKTFRIKYRTIISSKIHSRNKLKIDWRYVQALMIERLFKLFRLFNISCQKPSKLFEYWNIRKILIVNNYIKHCEFEHYSEYFNNLNNLSKSILLSISNKFLQFDCFIEK